MSLASEIRRKAFHNLAACYLAMYAVLGRNVSIILMTLMILIAMGVEFLRLRRPEINAWFLRRFDGLVRESEIMAPTAVVWTMAGVWVTMVLFTSSKIVMAALGFLIFGDTAAALAGKKWGKRPWKWNPSKTQEGSAGFALISTLWGCLFVKPHVALLAGCVAAILETRRWAWPDNFWLPIASGAALSIINLALGK